MKYLLSKEKDNKESKIKYQSMKHKHGMGFTLQHLVSKAVPGTFLEASLHSGVAQVSLTLGPCIEQQS